MKYTAFYLKHNDNTTYNCIIEAESRIEAITLFEELYPQAMLISLK